MLYSYPLEKETYKHNATFSYTMLVYLVQPPSSYGMPPYLNFAQKVILHFRLQLLSQLTKCLTT